MKVRSVGSNQTEIEYQNKTIVLFSYSTPVAAFVPGRGGLCTSTKYSKTTTRHINKAVERWGCSKNTVSQQEIDELCSIANAVRAAVIGEFIRTRFNEERKMKMQISHVNRDGGYIYNEFSEPLDHEDLPGLFRRLSKEFGRCISKVYVGDAKHIGWVFEKKVEYDRCSTETYIRETWVSLIEERYVDLHEVAS